jgi:hypothetical protein
MTTIGIIGAGPAGLLAAHAAVQAGYNIEILARGDKSKLYGAQYLHAEIPGIPISPPFIVKVSMAGTAADYRRKVYGSGYSGPVSAETEIGEHRAWDIRQAYDWLWKEYSSEIRPVELFPDNIESYYLSSIQVCEVVFTSAAMRAFCRERFRGLHSWQQQSIYAIGDAPELGIMCPIPCPDFMIQYDGTTGRGWYRSARIFGYTTCEWPGWIERRPPLANVAHISKPLSTNCTCWPGWIRIGRYGRWEKGILAHQAYEQVRQQLAGGVQGALFG